jgi:hypothetical protein
MILRMSSRPWPLLVVTVAACGGGTPAPASTASGAATACSSYQEVKAEEQALAERNAAAFTRALAGVGLHQPTFAADYFDGRDDSAHEWQLVKAEGGSTLLAPVSYLTCGVSNPWRLGQDAAGGVFALIVTARETEHHTRAICGCASDLPITCGGAAPRPVRWRWALPTGSEWKGPMAVVVDTETMTTSFAGRADGTACPPTSAPP